MSEPPITKTEKVVGVMLALAVTTVFTCGFMYDAGRNDAVRRAKQIAVTMGHPDVAAAIEATK